MRDEFDPLLAIMRAKERRLLKHRKPYRQSKLDRYRGEILSMHKLNATLGEIADCLYVDKNVEVDPSTICRYLKKILGDTNV